MNADDAVLAVLRAACREVTPDELETALRALGYEFGTFAVRNAVWRLSLGGLAVVTPGRGIVIAPAPPTPPS